jgi:NAD(P)H dehydrogenase (quinone)
MPERILVLLGHPRNDSFCAALAEAYARRAAQSGHEVRVLKVGDLPIDLDPPSFRRDDPQAGWVTQVQSEVSWSSHLVIIAPMWWGGVPAAFKALLDRVLLPGFAFRYGKGAAPDKLLTGRSARFIMTSDTPSFWFDLVLHRPLFHQMRRQILEFCGFKPVRQIMLGPIMNSSDAQRATWLERVGAMGAGGR